MDDVTLEELLNEEESASLDFKREQYPYAGATEEQKSELLKDILAFANAWRRTTAYILIGVDEVKGGRSVPLGVASHLADNDLQQFVNTKTNRPLTFSYRAYPFAGVQIGIIEIPVQERPVYLKKAFGKLEAMAVFVRRGSSTDKATPDEVARMGAAAISRADPHPIFELEWADLARRQSLGCTVEVRSLSLEPRLSAASIMPRRSSAAFTPSFPLAPSESHYEALIDYYYQRHFLVALGFQLRNASGVAAESVMLRCRIEKQSGLIFGDYDLKPIKPRHDPLAMPHFPVASPSATPRPTPLVHEFPTHWELAISFGRVLPKDTVWTDGVVYVGAVQSTALELRTQLLAANLPNPQDTILTINLVAESRPMERSDLT